MVRFKIEADEDVHERLDTWRGRDKLVYPHDDKVLYKSADELPTYHLANIVDDHFDGSFPRYPR